MKLLLATIESDEARTDLALKYLYCVLADSPMEVRLRSFGRNDLYTDIFEEIASDHGSVPGRANRVREALGENLVLGDISNAASVDFVLN